MTLAWLLPNHYPPWLSFYNEACMGVGVLLLAMSNSIVPQERGIPLVALAIVAMVAVPILQWSFGLLPYSGDAWVTSLYVMGFGCSIVIGYQWSGDKGESLAACLAVSLLAGAIISSILGLIQALNGGVLGIWGIDGQPGMQAKGNLAQPNHLALLIGFGCMSLWYLRERRWVGRIAGLALLVVLILGIGLTRSRASLLFGPVILAGVVFMTKRNARFETRVSTLLLAVIAHWGVAWFWPYLQDQIFVSHGDSFAALSDRGLHSSRYQAWRMFFAAVVESPWIGYGVLQTAAAQFSVADRFAPLGELFSQAHNLPLELALWCGLPIATAILCAIGYWFLSRISKISTPEAVCGFLTIALLGIHSLFEFPEQSAYFLVTVGLWIGVIEREIRSVAKLPVGCTLALVLITSVLFLEIGREYLIVEEDFRLARFEYLRIGHLRAENPAPDAPLLSNLRANARFYRTEPVAGMSDQAVADMYTVTKRYPYAKLLYGYSSVLALNNQPGEARRIFLKIRQIHGQRIYEIIKGDVRERVGAGQVGLRLLSDSLP